jgi:hypothetical protein
MRIAILSAFLVAALALLPATAPAATFAPATVITAHSATVLADIDVPKVDIDVKTHHDHAWYKNPFVIGLGVIVVVLLVALAGRGGGGTTIIERRS